MKLIFKIAVVLIFSLAIIKIIATHSNSHNLIQTFQEYYWIPIVLLIIFYIFDTDKTINTKNDTDEIDLLEEDSIRKINYLDKMSMDMRIFKD